MEGCLGDQCHSRRGRRRLFRHSVHELDSISRLRVDQRALARFPASTGCDTLVAMTKPADDDNVFVFQDTTHFTDADWAAVTRLRDIYQRDGRSGLEQAMARLAKEDPVRFTSIGYATEPVFWQNAIKDAMAAEGMDEEDVRELVRKLESPARDQ